MWKTYLVVSSLVDQHSTEDSFFEDVKKNLKEHYRMSVGAFDDGEHIIDIPTTKFEEELRARNIGHGHGMGGEGGLAIKPVKRRGLRIKDR